MELNHYDGVQSKLMAKVLGFLIRYFSNYYTLHRSDLAARAAPLDPRLKYLSTQKSLCPILCQSIKMNNSIDLPPILLASLN